MTVKAFARSIVPNAIWTQPRRFRIRWDVTTYKVRPGARVFDLGVVALMLARVVGPESAVIGVEACTHNARGVGAPARALVRDPLDRSPPDGPFLVNFKFFIDSTDNLRERIVLGTAGEADRTSEGSQG
jgi:hypothetical protein